MRDQEFSTSSGDTGSPGRVPGTHTSCRRWDRSWTATPDDRRGIEASVHPMLFAAAAGIVDDVPEV
jgi:hypothetical protein